MPRTVTMPEEKKYHRTFRSKCLNAYVATLIGTCPAVSGYASRRRWGWRKPFFNHETQGLLGGVHKGAHNSLRWYLKNVQ